MDHIRVFRDTLYGNIPVEYQLIWDLIDTREFQRLRRIRQLSGVSMVFHTAEHSRFGHSLGTYYIANRMSSEVVDLKETLNEYEKVVFLCAALLHDVGHGPYSHAFEHVFGIRHEQITCDIIESPLSEINKILSKYPNLSSDIAGIIRHDGKYPLIESLISSQLDVDRLDYLNRDAMFTGATYGVVDVDRLIRIMKVVDGQICYNDKGVHAIENYLMSRYHMYWQIYYHPVARSYEIILESIYKRIKNMIVEDKKIEEKVEEYNKSKKD
jgi:HD superfamily phosphohydrolase